MTKRQLCIVALQWALWCATGAPLAATAMDAGELTTLLADARTDMKMPGLRAAVRYPNGRIVSAAVGLADKEAGIPLDDHVGMPGGSTGKTFVAALTMLLVEDGVLSLDDPVARWLGEESWYQRLPNADTMQVRHLLSHSSGLKDYPGTVRFNLAMVRRAIRHGSAYFTPEELISIARSRRPLFAAGEGYRYTDAGYLVLGRVIESAAGEEYFDLLERRILEPLDLHEIRPARTSALPNITPGYQGGVRNLKKDGRMKYDPRSEWTGGGLTTNPTMLVAFFGALAEGRLLAPASLDAMLKGGWRDPRQPGWHYGFGLFVAADGQSFGHAGRWMGYRTEVRHDLRTGLTVAVQTNRDGRVNLQGLLTRIARRARQPLKAF